MYKYKQDGIDGKNDISNQVIISLIGRPTQIDKTRDNGKHLDNFVKVILNEKEILGRKDFV